MSKPKSQDLDHVLVIRGGAQHLFSSRGKDENGRPADLLLIEGKPEPLTSFYETAYADRLVADGVAIRVNANGTMENGRKHESIKDETTDAPSDGLITGITPFDATVDTNTPPATEGAQEG